jgi:hypothetical protein
METNVTGMFADQRGATQAVSKLVDAGFRPDEVHVVGAGSPDRHAFIDKSTADARRGVLLGAVIGAVGGAVAGLASGGIFGPVQGPVFGCLLVAAGGALLGRWIGSATKSQVQDELEHQVESGAVLVSVTADAEHKPTAVRLLAGEGGTSIVSTAGSYTAGVVPSTPA